LRKEIAGVSVNDGIDTQNEAGPNQRLDRATAEGLYAASTSSMAAYLYADGSEDEIA
jgi:hypothetical protein